MKRIIVTGIDKNINEEYFREKMKKNNFRRHSGNRATWEEWEKFLHACPSIGDTVNLQNSQFHFCDSAIFAGWTYREFRNMYCYNISKQGEVTVGTKQGIRTWNRTSR